MRRKSHDAHQLVYQLMIMDLGGLSGKFEDFRNGYFI